jgi:hypothetical protein
MESSCGRPSLSRYSRILKLLTYTYDLLGRIATASFADGSVDT